MDKLKMEKLIKAAGLELVANSPDIAMDMDNCTDLDIWIRFSGNELPTIEVNKTYIAKRIIEVLAT